MKENVNCMVHVISKIGQTCGENMFTESQVCTDAITNINSLEQNSAGDVSIHPSMCTEILSQFVRKCLHLQRFLLQ